MKQKVELTEQLGSIDKAAAKRIDQHLTILELSQKAAELYNKKSPEQKRSIIAALFGNLTLKNGALSVSYTKFAQIIAGKVLENNKITEVANRI